MATTTALSNADRAAATTAALGDLADVIEGLVAGPDEVWVTVCTDRAARTARRLRAAGYRPRTVRTSTPDLAVLSIAADQYRAA